jgi:hypothetical protein
MQFNSQAPISVPDFGEAMTLTIPAAAFDALLARIRRPGRYCPCVARVLSKPAPWELNF